MIDKSLPANLPPYPILGDGSFAKSDSIMLRKEPRKLRLLAPQKKPVPQGFRTDRDGHARQLNARESELGGLGSAMPASRKHPPRVPKLGTYFADRN